MLESNSYVIVISNYESYAVSIIILINIQIFLTPTNVVKTILFNNVCTEFL